MVSWSEPQSNGRSRVAKKKNADVLLSANYVRPKLVRPSKSMSSYTSIDELRLIIERAKKLGDTEYADLASERLLELAPDTGEPMNKTVVRRAKSVKTP